MPLFRRRADQRTEWFTVGVQGHRVVPGCAEPGIEQLDGLDDYVEGIVQRRPPRPDGRDSIAVLNAKMDHAESVNDLVAATVLACEELIERGILDSAQQPPAPPPAAPPKGLKMYDYIQAVHERAVDRGEWLQNVDVLFRLNGVGLLAPEAAEG